MLSLALTPLAFVNRCLEKLFYGLATTIVAVMVLALFLSAVTRYVSGTGYDWLIELPPVLSSWLVFPLLGPLLKSAQHIKVDIVLVFLSPSQMSILRLLIHLISLGAALIFFWAGLEATQLYLMLGQTMELEIDIPIWWMYLAFPVGFAGLVLFSLELLMRDLLSLLFVAES